MNSQITPDACLASIELARGDDYYVFRYEHGNEAELLAALLDLAEDDNHSFTWLDILLILRELNV
jgi:hypothetical protein